MFQTQSNRRRPSFFWLASLLVLLSLSALAMTLWIMSDFWHEQEIVAKIIKHLPAADLSLARELARELRLQFRLSALVIVNIIGTGIAITLLARAYLSSQRVLRYVRVAASDILNSLSHGVLTVDRDGLITSMNPQARLLLETDAAAIGRPLSEVAAGHHSLAAGAPSVTEESTAIRREYVANVDGHPRNFLAEFTELANENKEALGWVIHLYDVTQQVLVEKRIRTMERYSALGSLAAGLQHEIKNPLSALSLHVQLLEEASEAERTPENLRETLEILHNEIERMNSVLDGFRSFASTSELMIQPVDLEQLAKRLIRLIGPQAEQQGVRIEFASPQPLLPQIPLDVARFEQVLLNLAVNALQAMPEGGVLSIRLDAPPDQLTIEIEDTGGGVPETYQEKIFDPYFSTRSGGTGLGLSLCEKIVRQHDGTLEYRPAPRGASFLICLPRQS